MYFKKLKSMDDVILKAGRYCDIGYHHHQQQQQQLICYFHIIIKPNLCVVFLNRFDIAVVAVTTMVATNVFGKIYKAVKLAAIQSNCCV